MGRTKSRTRKATTVSSTANTTPSAPKQPKRARHVPREPHPEALRKQMEKALQKTRQKARKTPNPPFELNLAGLPPHPAMHRDWLVQKDDSRTTGAVFVYHPDRLFFQAKLGEAVLEQEIAALLRNACGQDRPIPLDILNSLLDRSILAQLAVAYNLETSREPVASQPLDLQAAAFGAMVAAAGGKTYQAKALRRRWIEQVFLGKTRKVFPAVKTEIEAFKKRVDGDPAYREQLKYEQQHLFTPDGALKMRQEEKKGGVAKKQKGAKKKKGAKAEGKTRKRGRKGKKGQ
ncbi:hypothetical protein JCM6882_002787 [Rhodosporidiobolus microsporus]